MFSQFGDGMLIEIEWDIRAHTKCVDTHKDAAVHTVFLSRYILSERKNIPVWIEVVVVLSLHGVFEVVLRVLGEKYPKFKRQDEINESHMRIRVCGCYLKQFHVLSLQ